MWAIGLGNPTDRTFVAVDTQEHDRIAGFSRWQTPQAGGNRERQWPDIPEGLFDMELTEAFFGGMEVNRKDIMGQRPHWFLEILGVHKDYQGKGVGASLLKWGTDQADKDGLETYLDGSTAGQPYYEKRHGFAPVKRMLIPDRPAYGSYSIVSMVRQPKTAPT
ncbi:hypothetical protein TI39_contig362g00002 [Zymoseptoria brevis]|uniref:N-acetyltransferase domain-containing protein n=1 Tax=Zymoseptoria brevis TaxID=1047168 RepID=A0A0F4GPK6_9PEZI|nr:hypothetical protein TI39_contig362g00002 [Zymoseptoria brevis]